MHKLVFWMLLGMLTSQLSGFFWCSQGINCTMISDFGALSRNSSLDGKNVIACHYHFIIYHHSDYNPTWLLFQGSFLISINNSGYSKAFISTSEWSPMIKLFQLEAQYGYGSKKRAWIATPLRGDPDVWNEGVTQVISNEFNLFTRAWIWMDRGYGSGVWIACASGVWIGTLHFELQPHAQNS